MLQNLKFLIFLSILQVRSSSFVEDLHQSINSSRRCLLLPATVLVNLFRRLRRWPAMCSSIGQSPVVLKRFVHSKF
jgi:hypothetical protein